MVLQHRHYINSYLLTIVLLYVPHTTNVYTGERGHIIIFDVSYVQYLTADDREVKITLVVLVVVVAEAVVVQKERALPLWSLMTRKSL